MEKFEHPIRRLREGEAYQKRLIESIVKPVDGRKALIFRPFFSERAAAFAHQLVQESQHTKGRFIFLASFHDRLNFFFFSLYILEYFRSLLADFLPWADPWQRSGMRLF